MQLLAWEGEVTGEIALVDYFSDFTYFQIDYAAADGFIVGRKLEIIQQVFTNRGDDETENWIYLTSKKYIFPSEKPLDYFFTDQLLPAFSPYFRCSFRMLVNEPAFVRFFLK